MTLQIPLPHSKKGPYKGNVWPIFIKDMEKLKSTPTVECLEQTILKYINRSTLNPSKNFNLRNLREILTDDQCLELMPSVADFALKLPDLFPEGTIQCLERDKIAKLELTREQVACLLAHMFFCTILVDKDLARTHCGHFTGARAPTGPVTFVHWLYRDGFGPTFVYLSSLLLYFEHAKDFSDEVLSEKVTFERLVSDITDRSWEPTGSSLKIVDVEVHLDGRIGDIEQVEVDFANQYVGFGTTGTQEELLLGTSPEFCVVVLFNEVLNPNEALLMTGAKRYGDYTGYGRSTSFTGPFAGDWNWNERKIIAIDAICGPKNQLGDNVMMRELCKAWTGFRSVPGSSVSTGHWGCGAFGGDQNIKCLVQVLAASLAGINKLDFYSFGDKDFCDSFQAAMAEMKGKTVGWLWEKILEFRNNERVGVNGGKLHHYILDYIGQRNTAT